MNGELTIVVALLAVTILMFAMNRPRMDVVALMMMTVLPLTGVIGMDDALAGFADPNIILIGAMFVVGESLVRTGVAQRLGDMLVRSAASSETRLVVMLMLLVTAIGAFMSSTAVVAIFIPIVLRICSGSGIRSGRLMMPLSVAALISGMMTLVATAPNLIINSQLLREGHAGFSFFAFTPFGAPVLALAILYMLWARRRLGSAGPAAKSARPRLSDWIASYGLAEREFRVRIGADSPWAGRRLEQLDLRGTSGINIIGVERGRGFARRLLNPVGSTQLLAGDAIFLDIIADAVDVEALCTANGLKMLAISGRYFTDQAQDIGMVELMTPPDSPLTGKSPAQAKLRSISGLNIIGMRHGSKPVAGAVAHRPMQVGDTLLAVGPWGAIRAASHRRELIVLNLPQELDEVVERPDRALHAVAILALIVLGMATGVLPNVQVALIGCLLLGLFGCMDMASAYRSVNWQTLIVIVGMLPFAIALENSGGVDLAAASLVSLTGDAGPRMALAAIFVVTALLGLFISNTATAVLMAPVAIAVADDLGASPYPFAMTVALSASAAFLTPVSSPVNMLVAEPGNYRFGDFVRIGLPLVLITMAVCILLVPLVFPF